MDKRKVIYYDNELTDEFSLAKITAKKIDGSFVYYKKSLFKRFTHFFWYRIVATPLAFLYTKIKFAHKIVGADKLKPFSKKGYFIYGNHTQDIGDALIPNMINIKQDKYIIVHPNNVSIPFVGRVAPSLGAIPLPDDKAAYKNFLAAIDHRFKEGCAIVIYPEAHIWPFYTGIRPFSDASFCYPIKYDAPVFCFTNTYQKRRFSKKPKIVTYVDGPFFCNKNLDRQQIRQNLRNMVYQQMKERSKLSDVEQIKYIKRETNDD